jgi:hypothetical protein
MSIFKVVATGAALVMAVAISGCSEEAPASAGGKPTKTTTDKSETKATSATEITAACPLLDAADVLAAMEIPIRADGFSGDTLVAKEDTDMSEQEYRCVYQGDDDDAEYADLTVTLTSDTTTDDVIQQIVNTYGENAEQIVVDGLAGPAIFYYQPGLTTSYCTLAIDDQGKTLTLAISGPSVMQPEDFIPLAKKLSEKVA